MARTLQDGSPHRLITIAALFAVSHQTMGPSSEFTAGNGPTRRAGTVFVVQHATARNSVVLMVAAVVVVVLAGRFVRTYMPIGLLCALE